jgi:pyruvyltransferase
MPNSVKVMHWNPRFRFNLASRIVRGRRLDNFGDVLAPAIVCRMLRLSEAPLTAARGRRLLAIGSILHLARDGDTLWGPGINGKVPISEYTFSNLDVRMVRGPLTKQFLESRGIAAPDVFGDPALLVSKLFPEAHASADQRRYATTVIPNLYDWKLYGSDPRAIHPCSELMTILRRIAASDRVISSSLHGIVVAESFGVPAQLLASRVEAPEKYLDYFLGTGRHDFEVASSIEQAEGMPGHPPPDWCATDLIGAFPYDLWN